MLQYLLNATAIWLISLVLFDVFLKKESYHVYNRFYLLLTFLLGALLPLVHWPQDAAPVMQAAVKLPVQQVLIAKEQVINAATPVSHAFDWDQVLGGIYVIGVLVAISLLLIDIVKLAAYYRGGPRTKDGKWLVIETGKEHAPFSFLNTLFVNSRAQYSDEEWEMILVHEQRHTALLHFADLLLMQAARVLFWFHPLIYVYNKRLLLVHEYQADKTAKQPAQVYGRFLVEQAILQSAPALSHSFNRSPIKNRIAMLTHRSSEIARSKLLLFIPLLIVCVFCFSQNSFSNKPKKEGNVCLYRGNKIEFLAPKKPDSYLYTDEQTGAISRRPITWPMTQIKVNGEKVYDPGKDKDITRPALRARYKNLSEYILHDAARELEGLTDGKYFLLVEDVVINKNGRVVYFNTEVGVNEVGVDINNKQAQQKQVIDNKINDLMNAAPLFKPAMVNGKPVAFLINSVICANYGYGAYPYDFVVKDHKIVWNITSETQPPM